MESQKNQLPKVLTTLPRVRLARVPTPLERLERLEAELGRQKLFIKRDDLTGLATGGNKTRKLEFLMADALAKNATCVITAGGPQSNHCRQTAAAAARLGLDCHLVLGGASTNLPQGNLLLDQLLGAQIHWVEKPSRNQKMQELAELLSSRGETPYVIPVGGSNALGAVGYVLAMFELVEQIVQTKETIDRVFVATSSGGTQAGLVLGAALAGFRGDIVGISIDQHPEDNFSEDVARIANECADLLGCSTTISPNQIKLNYDYLGEGYGVMGTLERNAIYRFAQTEGILIGPVYTGRALGGMMGIIEKEEKSDPTTALFWHTGDESALHGYVQELVH